ncbi:MAG: cardiolipin synthase [Bacteroidales bacterium]|jgi:cardiolipin synthase|nr:cardiolipin synthase [Bacteroidales bacterium]
MGTSTIFSLIFSIIYLLLIIGTILIVISENRNPSKTIAWLLLLVFLPAIGIIMYFIFGQDSRNKKFKGTSYQDFSDELINSLSEYPEKLDLRSNKEKVRKEYHTLVELLEKSDNSWMTYGNDVEVITLGTRKFELLITDLESAQNHIHMEYFYFRKDETGKKIREILMRKASQGVEVRFIHENVANIAVSPRFYNKMKKAGVEVVRFTKNRLSWIRRQLNFRDHRKIVIIDGKVGYLGGMNIGNEYVDDWRDTHLRIKGQAVNVLQSTFLYYFFCSGGKKIKNFNPYFPPYNIYSENLMQIVPESPASKWQYLQFSMIHLINITQKYIYIQTPYYLPPEPLLQALQTAALRGVDVRIMLSHKSDFAFMDPAIHSYYEESLQAGIKIFERFDKFMHAKSLVADDYISIIGSANLDFRSLELSFEINSYIYDENIAFQNKHIFLKEMELCEELFLEEWIKRPWYKKLAESVMRLLSPLL